MPNPLPGRASPRTVGGFFRLLEINSAEVEQHEDLMERLRGGQLHGAVIHGVYEAELMERVVSRLENHDPPFVQSWFPDAFRSWFYGRNLNLTLDLGEYFQDARTFQHQLQELFPSSLGFADYLTNLLSRMDRGKPYRNPPGPEPGQSYMPTTIRAHLEAGFIPPHVDNEQAVRPSYRHLRSLVTPHMWSFVLALSQPEGGGALEVFNARFDPLAAEVVSDDAVVRPDIEGLESVQFHIPPGALMLVDSGQYLHRVTPIEGRAKRWTMCSFMAESRAGDAVYCWG